MISLRKMCQLILTISNRDENIDFDTKMKTLQSELRDLLVAEEKSKADLLTVFKELGYEIDKI